MSNTTNLQLPYLDANQNQKTVTHNAALTVLDALVNAAVQSAILIAPPAAPADGQRWIVAAGATGAWAGKDLNIAAWQDGAWAFYPPRAGLLAYNVAAGTMVVWSGTAWAPLASLLALLGITALGIGTAADAGNPLSATLNAALFNALATGSGGTGDVRVKLNKATAANSASFLFQDGFAGRAEVGLCGDDNFHFKVSADGSNWYDGIVVAGATGAVTIPGALQSSTGVTAFTLSQRRAITGQPVATVQPASANAPIAFDLMPSGTAVPVYGDLIAWLDICDADVASNTSTPVNYLHLAARTAVLEIGSSSLYGGAGKPISFTYNSAEVMRLNATGVGIGTSSPNYRLSVSQNVANLPAWQYGSKPVMQVGGADGSNARLMVDGFGGNPILDFRTAGGTAAAPTAVQSGTTIGQIEAEAYNGSAYTNVKASMVFAAAEAWTATANGTYVAFYTTANTTTTIVERMRIDNAGNLQMGGGNTVIDANRLLNVRSYTVATLPSAGTVGRLAYASDARMFNGAGAQEAASAGTGGLVVDNGTAWKIVGTNAAAVA